LGSVINEYQIMYYREALPLLKRNTFEGSEEQQEVYHIYPRNWTFN